MSIAERIGIDPAAPDPAAIERAAALLRGGGVAIFPTRGLYGLGADALNPAAVARVVALKGRPPDKPLLVLISTLGMLPRLVRSVPPVARRLMAAIWPGNLTIVLDAAPGLPAALTAGTGRIGLRLAGHPVAAALAKALGGPLTATSANLSGAGGCSRIDRIAPQLASAVDLILDAGPLEGGPGSTVIDASRDSPLILREGAVPAAEIWRAVRIQEGIRCKV